MPRELTFKMWVKVNQTYEAYDSQVGAIHVYLDTCPDVHGRLLSFGWLLPPFCCSSGPIWELANYTCQLNRDAGDKLAAAREQLSLPE